jgi:regulator of ribosome biosynthesis
MYISQKISIDCFDYDHSSEDIDQYIEQNTRDSTQKLIGALFSLPTASSPDGPLAMLHPPTLLLPREKKLPKPKEPTKWEKFAAAKGIKKTKREKKVWDEEKQEWVNRWGWKGKNKEAETQWLHEVPADAGMITYNSRNPEL